MKKYKIRRSDTLESIAATLGLSVFELRNFHNNQCKLSDLLGDKLPSHLKELWYESKEQRIQEDFTRLKEKKPLVLSLRPQSGNRTYRVTVSVLEDDPKDSLSYLIRLHWLDGNQVRIYREDLYLNKEEPTLIAPQLGTKIASALYPMELIINRHGEITGLANYPEILQRWKKTEKELHDFYTGETVRDYIQRSGKSLSHPGILLDKLRQDWFLQAFFNGIYQKTEQESTSFYPRNFPLFPGISPVEYTVSEKAQAVEQEGLRSIRLEIRGSASDRRTRFDYKNRNDIPFPLPGTEPALEKGDYRGLYFLDPFSHQIEGLYLECSLELEKTRKVYVTASLVHEPEKGKIIKEEGIIIIGQKEEKQSNKNSFLFD